MITFTLLPNSENVTEKKKMIPVKAGAFFINNFIKCFPAFVRAWNIISSVNSVNVYGTETGAVCAELEQVLPILHNSLCPPLLRKFFMNM